MTSVNDAINYLKSGIRDGLTPTVEISLEEAKRRPEFTFYINQYVHIKSVIYLQRLRSAEIITGVFLSDEAWTELK